MLPMTTRRQGRYDPLDLLGREFDRAMSRWFDGGAAAEGGLVGMYPVDIREDNDHIYVDAELPGFKRDEINVTLENGVLHIAAERKEEQKKGEAHLEERRFTRVARSFTLPNSVDENKVDAKYQDGVLRLTLNKREEVKPRKVEIK
jgi:HSP20 family protein